MSLIIIVFCLPLQNQNQNLPNSPKKKLSHLNPKKKLFNHNPKKK